MRGRIIGLTLVAFAVFALSCRPEMASAQSRAETLRYVTGASVNTLDPNVPGSTREAFAAHKASDHFAAWEKQGWKLGALTSVHINVEVGGGTGKIDFPLANVTVQNK